MYEHTIPAQIATEWLLAGREFSMAEVKAESQRRRCSNARQVEDEVIADGQHGELALLILSHRRHGDDHAMGCTRQH